ncbi:MAG: hypothetical protein U1B30_06780 [Pseudomonadota bacterium]|nr:hypothetical protein [Pseudomonadota bacterium]
MTYTYKVLSAPTEADLNALGADEYDIVAVIPADLAYPFRVIVKKVHYRTLEPKALGGVSSK